MKKSILNIALLSMLFVLGACSTDPDKTPDKEIPESSTTVFLNSVKTKDAFQGENPIGVFGTDGKTFVVDGAFLTLEVSGTLIFESASSGTEAIYTDTSAKEVVITLTTDGGTIKVDTTETIFTYVSVVDPVIAEFLNSVKTKDAFQSKNKIGTFGTDGKTFVVDGAFLTLGVSGTLIFESASSGTEAIYKDTSDKVVTITLTADGGTITVDTTETIFTYGGGVDPNKTAFLASVKDKDAYQGEELIGAFGTDGTFTISYYSDYDTILGVTGDLTFESATSPTEAIYLDDSTPAQEVTFTLTANGGTIKSDKAEIDFTYEKVVDPNKTAFLNSVKDKDTYEWEEIIGTFNYDGNTFTISEYSDYDTILGVTRTLTFESATSSTVAVYTDTYDKVVTITLNGDVGGTIKVDTTETIFTYIATIAWQTVGKKGFSDGLVNYTSLAFDKNGVPYLAYTDGFGKATVMKYVSGTWTVVGKKDFSDGRASYTSLAIDKDGVPYLAYSDGDDYGGGSDKKATVMKYDNNTWTVVGTKGFSDGEVMFTSLAIDKDGVPYLAYQDGFQGPATVMKYVSGTWTVVGTKGFSDDWVMGTSLAIDKDGVPYLAYTDMNNSFEGPATVMKYNKYNDIWTVVGKKDFSDDGARDLSLAIDKDGVPYVAYGDVTGVGKATVMKYVSGTWTVVGKKDFSDGRASYTSLAIDKDGVPYLAYSDGDDYGGGSDKKATVMKYDNNTWTVVGKKGFSDGTVNYTSLALDKDGVPYVAYKDGGNDKKATVMKYDIVK